MNDDDDDDAVHDLEKRERAWAPLHNNNIAVFSLIRSRRTGRSPEVIFAIAKSRPLPARQEPARRKITSILKHLSKGSHNVIHPGYGMVQTVHGDDSGP